MPGFAPRLPLSQDVDDGFALLKTFASLARQNLKMLVLTSPGERIMMPDFGVGLKQYLFENNPGPMIPQIESRVREQAIKYLPYIDIIRVVLSDPQQQENQDYFTLQVSIEYSLGELGTTDLLTFDITSVELG